MLADLRIAAHRAQVQAALADATESAFTGLLQQQAGLRNALAETLPPPVYQPLAWTSGSYPLGLPETIVAQYGIHVVGGAVRDRLLGRTQSPDIDCVVPAQHWDAFLHYAQVAGHRPRIVPLALGCKLQAGPAAGREFVCTRRDSYVLGGQLRLAEPATLRADPWRRDFTLQALYAEPSSGDVWDPFGACTTPELRAILPGALVEDPLRVVRLLRAYVTHGLPMDPDTESEARAVAACHLLSARVAPHRTLAEFDRAARTGVLGSVLRHLANWQWPGAVAPDHRYDGHVARSATQWLRQVGARP